MSETENTFIFSWCLTTYYEVFELKFINPVTRTIKYTLISFTLICISQLKSWHFVESMTKASTIEVADSGEVLAILDQNLNNEVNRKI